MQKELLLGFTTTKKDSRDQFDDVIAGKGKVWYPEHTWLLSNTDALCSGRA